MKVSGFTRELQNRIRRALATTMDRVITPFDLGLSGNNISQAARLLKISRPTLHDLLKKHGIIINK